ncbi:general secretory pathway protein GspE [Desulfuromonas versatilis]|uniref:General secretory pathway protein GspE n=1 Tax=Desulfuromonas versatilis TaxID=2802975 RepID=A0ABN6E1E8_9BACT|nr:ATPase, T2SS/T4P/T4SS family [Desulfuromonas versatilis]BCR06160.1 general secretory pathway protein GspE [Desulfuromonas versatilis]
MEQNIIIKFLDGQTIEATLAEPLKSSSSDAEVTLKENGIRLCYSLYDICCIYLLGKANWSMPPQPNEVLEEVETTTGDYYQVRTHGNKKSPNGFYGFPTDRDAPFKSIFFCTNGVRMRHQQRPLGDILQEQGAVTPKAVKEVLEEQKKLREKKVGEILAEANNLPQEAVENTLSSANQSGKIPKNARIGDILIAAGLVTREQVEEALSSQQQGKKKRVGELLIDKGLITEDQLLTALATKFGMRMVDLEKVSPSPEALNAIPFETVRQLKILPLEAHRNRLVVVTSQPTDPTIGDSLRFSTNRSIELVVANSKQIEAAIQNYYVKSEDQVQDLISEMSDDIVTVEEEASDDARFSESDSQIIKLVNKLLLEAYQRGVSDIHVEPGMGKQPVRVRYRIDGVCQIAHQIAATYQNAIISRIKIMAKLDIAEHRKPQSGKILLRQERRMLEYRVEVTPTVGGKEDAVLRLLANSKPLPLDKMGFSTPNLKGFREILAKPYGIILCVGPTGSGKTTSLHSALGHINTAERKIWTAEDPVEITQQGLRQVQVHPKIGFTFAEAMRSFLRADPDVIMIGEMRDPETAKTAIEASLTGHLVFSTLHTNSAPETVVRLIEMGMDPFNFSEAMLGILAQRLTRRLCPDCRESYQPSREEYDELVRAYGARRFIEHAMPDYSDELTLMRRVGCPKCDKSGYRGRIAIHELMLGSEAIGDAIKKNMQVNQLRTLAIDEGMRTLRMDGVTKVFQGQTDLEQILRVCA